MYITHAETEAAKGHYLNAPWSTAWKRLLDLEQTIAANVPQRVDVARFNWLLEQTRLNAKYLHSMVVLWTVEPQAQRLATIVTILEDILSWPDWALEGIFDLSTGEIAVCLCGLLDAMESALPADLRKRIEQQLTSRALEPYLEITSTHKIWWNKSGSNWSAVCHAGGYAAACRLRSHPNASEVRSIAWAGIEAYVARQPNDGGSAESLSYWQYGTRYLTYALLIYHQQHGAYPALVAQAPLCHGIRFYLTFMRNGASTGFGDCSYAPPEALLLKFCDIVGDAQGRAALEHMLNAYLEGELLSPQPRFLWNQPREAQLLLFLRNQTPINGKSPEPLVVAFPDTGWYAIRAGALQAALRCGDNTSGHAMCDQLAINVALDDVTLIGYLENHPYTSGWFNRDGESTRQLYFEEQSISKNTIAVNGTGQIRRGVVEAVVAENSIQADAGHLYPGFVTKALRSVQTDGTQIHLIDQITTTEPCWHEVRFFSEGDIVLTGPLSVRINRNGKSCDIGFSADCPIRLLVAPVLPSIGVRNCWNLLRVTTEYACHESTFHYHIKQTLTQDKYHESKKINDPYDRAHEPHQLKCS